MRVEVDLDRCEGNAICVGIDPDLFDLNDDEQAEVKMAPSRRTGKPMPSRPSPSARGRAAPRRRLASHWQRLEVFIGAGDNECAGDVKERRR